MVVKSVNNNLKVSGI